MKRAKTSLRDLLCDITALVSFLFASIFFSCTNSSIEKQFSEAESLIIERPDSTVSLLVQMDTTRMSKDQVARQELMFLYTQLIYGNQIPIDSAGVAEGDEFFVGKFNNDEIKWLIVKSAEAYRSGNPVARIELLKDAEFLAIQSNNKVDLGIIYFYLSKVYEQGFNGTFSKYYADMALAIFKDLNWESKIRDARMAIVGAAGTSSGQRNSVALSPQICYRRTF